MTPEQRRVYDAIVSGPRGTLIGPLRAALHSPDLADRWQHLGEFLRYRTCLPPRLNELAILVTARRWNSQIEWYVHAAAASKAGLPESVIAAIRVAEPPVFDDPDDAAVYEYVRQLQQQGEVAEDAYDRMKNRWGAPGVVELTALAGYYTMVSMTLNAHEIPLPDGAEPPLRPVAEQSGTPALTTLPAGSSRQAG
jgi:4-carboxymuconolactone decarboxylase